MFYALSLVKLNIKFIITTNDNEKTVKVNPKFINTVIYYK